MPSKPELTTTATANVVELVDRHEAARLLCYRGKTSHTLRRLELRGLLTPVRISNRAVRYRLSDIRQLIDRLAGTVGGEA